MQRVTRSTALGIFTSPSKMVMSKRRTTVYLPEAIDKIIRELAHQSDFCQADFIRRAIARQLNEDELLDDDLAKELKSEGWL